MKRNTKRKPRHHGFKRPPTADMTTTGLLLCSFAMGALFACGFGAAV